MNIEDLFKVTSLTDSINKLPVAPGLVGSMGLFAEKGIATTSAFIEVKNGRLVLVPNTSRSGEPQVLGNGKREGFSLTAPHLPLGTVVLPTEIQDVRAFGEESVSTGLTAQASVINDKLAGLKTSIEATREYHRVGALRGKVLDADGQVIHDYFSLHGVVKKSTNVPLSAGGTDVKKACLDAKRYAQKKLGGVVVKGYRALCGAEWFDAFTGHDNVKAAFAGWQEAQDRLGGDMRAGFTFGGIEFIECADEVSGQAFIPADIAQVFPVAPGVFAMYNAPANYNEAVNTIGLPFYSKAEPRRMGKGWDLEAQANPMAICHYPEALVELKAT